MEPCSRVGDRQWLLDHKGPGSSRGTRGRANAREGTVCAQRCEKAGHVGQEPWQVPSDAFWHFR